jgi:phosphate ABC transporter phosphate-binding protein
MDCFKNWRYMSKQVALRILIRAFFGLGAICAVHSQLLSVSQAESLRLNAGGSSFVFPLMSKWTNEYGKKTGHKINYQSIGSGAGVQQMLVKTLDFGCTDAPMNDEQLSKARSLGGEVLHIPLIMGAVVPVYHVEGVDASLHFSGGVLADIFLGKIKNWNDPAIVALNPGTTLPDTEITVVHRSDGSGTSFVFTEFLSKVSEEWKNRVGAATAVNWPTGIGQKGNEGIAGQVGRTDGAIGYVELIYALQNEMTYGAVQNQAGEFIKGGLESVTAAAEGALKNLPDDLRYSITNAPGKDSYPIAGTTWAVFYKNDSKEKVQAISSFLRWATTEGQSLGTALDYAKLPQGVVDNLTKKLDLLK